jgi:hypothetical protein
MPPVHLTHTTKHALNGAWNTHYLQINQRLAEKEHSKAITDTPKIVSETGAFYRLA